MVLINNPAWIQQHIYPYSSFKEVPQQVFDSINRQLDTRTSAKPLVSIVITVLNEEVSILKTISSLAQQQTIFPYEIIVVNNNCTDDTQKTLNALHIRHCYQSIQGWGPGRQKGMEAAQGLYILLADADCVYPPCWVQKMTEALKQKNVVSVYGRYRFISEAGYPRWQLQILESLKDFIASVRHIRRPFLNSYGMSMGFIKVLGMKEGFYMNNTRGEDGRMCFDLMKYGKIVQVKDNANRVWTAPRTLRKDGSLAYSLWLRIAKELKRFPEYFHTKMKYLSPKNQEMVS